MSGGHIAKQEVNVCLQYVKLIDMIMRQVDESRKRRYGKAKETWSADKETNPRGSKTQS